MFDFVVNYLNILKHVPVLALVFDSMIFLYGMIFHKEIIKCIEEIESEIRTWKGVSVSLHKYGGRQFNYKNKEIGHIHSNGLVDVLFSAKIKSEMIREKRAEEHHVFKKSGWISFYIKSGLDKKNALELLHDSYLLIDNRGLNK